MSKRSHLLMLSVGFLLCLVALAVWLIAKQRGGERRIRAEIDKRLAALHAAGQPISVQDLAKMYPDPPPERDAIRLLQPAFAKLLFPEESTNLPFFSQAELPHSGPLDKSVFSEGQEWLSRNQAALALIPWDQLEGAWVGSGFTNGFTKLTQAPLGKVMQLSKLLCLDALCQAELQHPNEAQQSLRRALTVAHTLKNDTPIHFMVKSSMEKQVCRVLRYMLNQTNIANTDLGYFETNLSETKIEAVKEFLINERCLGLCTADMLRRLRMEDEGNKVSPVRKLFRIFQWRLIYRDEDLVHYLDWNERSLAALDLPLSNAIPLLQNMERQNRDALKGGSASFLKAFQTDRHSFQTSMELEPTHFLLPTAEAVAYVRVTVAALGLDHWRRMHGGQLPDSLAELVPDPFSEIPADPFSGQPLRYKRLAKGCIVYSVGHDFTDDGGTDSDIIFIIGN